MIGDYALYIEMPYFATLSIPALASFVLILPMVVIPIIVINNSWSEILIFGTAMAILCCPI